MATSKKFSELPAASSVGNGDLFAIAHEDAQAETGYVSQKLTAAQAGQKVNGDTEYPTSLPSFPENGQNPFAALEKLNADIDSLYPVVTVSGSIANFTTSLIKPLVGLSSTIVAQQAGSGTPSPQNVRSISGYDEVVLTHTGKNLCPILASQTINGVQVVASSDGTLTFNRVSASNLSSDFTINVSLPNGQYVISANNTSIPPEGSVRTNTFFRPYDGNETSIAVRTFDTVNKTYSFTNSVSKIMIRIDKDFNESNFVLKMQLEKGSTATAYEPYSAETKTIALGQTVYGGYIDKNTGKLVITKVLWTKNTADMDNAENYPGWKNAGIVQYFGENVNREITDAFCNVGTYFSINTLSGQDILFLSRTRYNLTQSEWKALAVDVQIVMDLQTPIETDITIPDITTFAGEQNIFSDCGDVEVQYKQGIQEYIDAKIAETQALIL